MPTNEEFWNDERVRDTIVEARKVFGDVKTTEEQWHAMDRTLAMAYLYCSKDLQDMVMSTLDESAARKLLTDML